MAGGVNLYAYAGNNPISFSDPYGLCTGAATECPGGQNLLDAAKKWVDDKVDQVVGAAAAILDALTPGGDLVRASTGIEPTSGASLSGGARVAAAAGAVAKIAGMAGLAAGAVADGTATAASGPAVYRVFGGDAQAMGRSWTTISPGAVGDYRAAAGLPTGNTGRFVAEGTLTSSRGVVSRAALSGAGGSGGLPELKSSVATGPGPMAFTLMLYWANSRAQVRVAPIRAALVAL